MNFFYFRKTEIKKMKRITANAFYYYYYFFRNRVI